MHCITAPNGHVMVSELEKIDNSVFALYEPVVDVAGAPNPSVIRLRTVRPPYENDVINVRRVIFPAGSTIFSEGDDGNSAFVIITGSVDVIIGTGKKAKKVASLKDGDVFGEMSLIEPGPRSATIKAVTDTECEASHYDNFLALINDNPEISAKFMKTLVVRIRQMNEMVSKLDPKRRGLRGLFSDWRHDFNRANAAESERWSKLSDEEREAEKSFSLMYMGTMF